MARFDWGLTAVWTLYLVALALLAGTVIGLSLALRSRRRALNALRLSEQRHRDVVEAQSDLICRYLPDTTLTFVNDAYCRFFNKTAEELIGTKFVDLIPELARADAMHQVDTLVASRKRGEYEHAVLGPDGSLRWQHWTDDVVIDESGRLVELQGIGRDVTERRRILEALNQSNARNQALLRALPDMMFVQSIDGTYLDYHAPDPSLLLCPPEQFLGKRMDDILPPELSERFRQAFAEITRTGQPALVEYSLEINDSPRFFEARLVGFDERRRVLAVVRDVSDRREAETARRQAQGDAANAARLSWMGALTASIAHDINQPLATIEANASVGLQWMDASVFSSKDHIREALIDITAAAHRASDVIQRTLDLFSRRPIGRAPIHPADLVAATLASMEPVLRGAGIVVTTDVPDDLPEVHADQVMMQQVLISLISNAMDAMARMPSRALFLDSAQHDGFVHLAVEDTGPGIDPGKAETLFVPFRTTKPGHIGIGLSISRAIVEAHGGVLHWVPGTRPGARFEVSLPAMRHGRPAAGARHRSAAEDAES
jgi:PAS domain S-box-containing protein